MTLHRVILIALVVGVFSTGAKSQEEITSLITLDRIYKTKEFTPKKFVTTEWHERGKGYTTLESSETLADVKDLVRYDLETGERKILVGAESLIPNGRSLPLQIDNYSWSPDGGKLLIFTNSKRVWRTNTRGDYWTFDLSNQKLTQLGGDAMRSTLMFATFSPDGSMIGYVRENNIYVEDVKSGKIKRLTSDGSKTIINGTFDWVYEEEFGLQNGFRWSPDSKLIAYWQLDASGVGEFNMINTTDSVYSKIIPLQYPKVGTTNSSAKVGVVKAKGGKTKWMKVSGDPRNNYIARMEWAANSEEIIIQRLNRNQNENQLMLGNAKSGNVRTILTEIDEAWLDVVEDWVWTEDGGSLTWVSERDGWRHVYLVSRDGKKVDLITPGEFDVINILNIDTKNGWLYYIASPDNPTQRYLYRSPLKGGNPERLTPEGQGGYHSYNIAPGAKWAFHTYSSFIVPPVTELIRLPNHKPVRTLVDNAKLKENVAGSNFLPEEFTRLDIGDGVEMDAWIIRPLDFDPEKKYPLLVYVYSEPAGQTVLDVWRERNVWHQMIAQQGYVVLSMDNRGTPSPRGRAWRKAIYRQIGIINSSDQAKGLRAALKKWDFIDPERVAVWGWSGGGSMSLNLIFKYGDLYGTAMSIAPVSNQLYYDTIYQERYMGLPKDNPEGFRDGSPINYAHQLEGNLLLIHGTGDDNVHYQNSEALVDELIRHGKHFTFMPYPNRTHAIREGEGTREHLFTLLTRYLREHVTPGPLDSNNMVKE